MRNEPLSAYSLHQRPLQEKRSIYYLLTKEHGILHGVGKKGIPQFVPLTLFASGKKSLKTLQQVSVVENTAVLIGAQQYAALYINEITIKLLPIEESVPHIYLHYAHLTSQLQQLLSDEELRLVLRHYEYALFKELGFEVDLQQDSEQEAIEKDQYYRYSADTGWIPVKHEEIETGQRPKNSNLRQPPVLGASIIKMRAGINHETIAYWSTIHKQLVDFLFDYQPLQSRILWRQFQRYQ